MTVPTMFYPLNPCGHLSGPGGSCSGVPECNREPVNADKQDCGQSQVQSITDFANEVREVAVVDDLLGKPQVFSNVAKTLGCIAIANEDVAVRSSKQVPPVEHI